MSTESPLPLSAREARWVLRRCSRRGHVLAHLDDPISAVFTGQGPHGQLLRCLRCGDFVDGAATPKGLGKVLGGQAAPVSLSAVPQVLRGAHGRKLAVLRLLAIERAGRGLLLVVAAAGIARLANSRVSVAEWLGRLAKAAQPLGDQIGWDVLHSHLLARADSLLGRSASTFTTVAWLIAAYGVLQLIEGIGLWGGWRWAEYLAAVATSLFVPLEVYELHDHATLLKAGALGVNVLAVGYLVVKGRLFGVRGGHAAYRDEVRDATLLADELSAAGRSTDPLASDAMA